MNTQDPSLAAASCNDDRQVQTDAKRIKTLEAKVADLERLRLANEQAIANLCESNESVDARWCASIIAASGRLDEQEIVGLIKMGTAIERLRVAFSESPAATTMWLMGKTREELVRFVFGLVGLNIDPTEVIADGLSDLMRKPAKTGGDET